MFNPVSKKILSTAFLFVIVSNSTGAFAYNAYANLFPFDTPLPDGHWISIQNGASEGHWDGSSWVVGDWCDDPGTGINWLFVLQRSAVISLMMVNQLGKSTIGAPDNGYKIAVPYNEPVWVDGLFNTNWGTGCVVNPGQTLTIVGIPSVLPDGEPNPTLIKCQMRCP